MKDSGRFLLVILIISLLGFGLVFVVSKLTNRQQATAQEQPKLVGRYLLQSGLATTSQPALYKIDTVTGKVWVYMNRQDAKGTWLHKWQMIDSD